MKFEPKVNDRAFAVCLADANIKAKEGMPLTSGKKLSIFSKFADDCGSAAQESKLVEKNNSNSRQFLTFVVVRKNRSVEEVNQSIFQNGVYKMFRTSPT